MWLKATRGFHVSLRDLPPFLVQILAREARYKRQDIEVVPAKLSEDEKYAIVFINMFNSRGRKDAFESKGLGEYSSSNPLVRSLVSKGLLKLQGAGVKVTTQGKNVRKSLDRKYENTW